MTDSLADGPDAHLLGGVDVIGASPAMAQVRRTVRQFATTRLSVLLIGETGTGKEVCARAIHELSRRPGRFLPVDCAALPPGLVESELFGHRRGAFTGAHQDSPGILNAAHGGTVFLDEVCSLPPDGQAKLLRTVETREVRPLGRGPVVAVDVRFVAALQPETGEPGRHQIRPDLQFRLGGVVLRLPPLRERKQDIKGLARYFAGRAGLELEATAVEALCGYEWPGNVRELKATIERAVALADGPVVRARDVQASLELGYQPAAARTPLTTDQQSCREHLVTLLTEHRGDTSRVAEVLGVARSTIYRRCRALGVSVRAHMSSGSTRRRIRAHEAGTVANWRVEPTTVEV